MYSNDTLQEEIKRILLGTPGFERCLQCNKERYSSNAYIVRNDVSSSTYYDACYKKCDKIWWCIPCHIKLSKRNIQKATYLADSWISSNRCIVQVTFDTAHSKFDDFQITFDRFTKTFQYDFTKRSRYKNILRDFSILADIRSLEIVYSIKSGFSAHWHNTYFINQQTDAVDEMFISRLESRFYEFFKDSCSKLLLPKPSRQYGVRAIKAKDSGLAAYAMKAGFRGNKGNTDTLSPLFDFPELSLRGERSYEDLFRIYALATRGTSRAKAHPKAYFARDIYKKLDIAKLPNDIERTILATLNRDQQSAIAKDKSLIHMIIRKGYRSQDEINRYIERYGKRLTVVPQPRKQI